MVYRLQCRHAQYARAKGRNGWFVPRIVEFEFFEHEDGTPLVTLRLFSRRESAVPPLELTIPLSEWEAHVLTIQLRANDERKKGLGRSSRERGHAS
jgi:hypothetical protein